MRIVAGTAKGRRLLVPSSGAAIRPTADRVRETIFNILGQWTDGLAVLDLFSGTGALALEALSRGARDAVLVDSGQEAVRLGRQNADALGLGDRAEVLRLPVERAIERLAKSGRRFDLVFADPPYAARLAGEVLRRLSESGLVTPQGRVVVEHDRRDELAEAVGQLRRYDQRRFGDTSVDFYAPA